MFVHQDNDKLYFIYNQSIKRKKDLRYELEVAVMDKNGTIEKQHFVNNAKGKSYYKYFFFPMNSLVIHDNTILTLTDNRAVNGVDFVKIQLIK
jgi:hypothetical protein